MTSKQHRRLASNLLTNLAHWMENSSTDYELVDLERALNEAKQHYANYLAVKNDNKDQVVIERKSYK